MPIDPSVQRKAQSIGDEIVKLNQAHKDQMDAASDQLKNQITMLKSKKDQILDAEKKRNAAANATANKNSSTANVSSHHDVGLSTGGAVKEQADFTDMVQIMINEKKAEGGFNYEKEVNDKLKKMGVAHKDSGTAGSSADAPDAKFHHNGKEHNLEIKQNSKAMFGQIELHHNGKEWDVSERSKKKYPETHKAIHDSGFLKKVNKQWDKPTGDYDEDLKKGNVYHTHHDAEPIKAHYGKDRKTDYIQIGGGHGFYHTGKDSAKLGSPELEGKATMRARMKYRGTDKKTGKKKYGALIVMGLKDAEKSHHNLDNDVQKEWIEAGLNSINEAHKIGDKVEIVKGSSAGTVGHIGEIRHGAYKGAPKTFTVFHGEKGATQVKKEHIKGLKEEVEYIVEETECFSKGFWSGQQEEPKTNPHTKGSSEYTEYENGYMQGVMTRRRMQTEGLKHHVAAAAIAVAGALGGHAHAQSAPAHDTAKPAATATAQDSDKSPHDGAPKSEHKARIDKAQADGSMSRGEANVERMKHGLNPSFGRVRLQAEGYGDHDPYYRAQENKKSAEAAHKQGDHLAYHLHMADHHDDMAHWSELRGRHHVSNSHLRKAEAHAEEANKLRNKEKGVKEEVAANNVGGGSIAGTQGDAGKKAVMTKEPLKRKTLKQFKSYVSQEHENN